MAALPELLTVEAVAKHLGVSSRTIRRRIRDGVITAHRFGNSVRVDAASVMRLLVSTTGTEPSEKMADNSKDAPSLYRQRGRERIWTTLIDGIELPLGTSDAADAKRRLAVVLTRRSDTGQATGSKRQGPWRVTYEAKRGYTVKYYDAENRRKNHRIPSDLNPPIATQEAAEKYAERWYELEIAQRQIAEVLSVEQDATIILADTVPANDTSGLQTTTPSTSLVPASAVQNDDARYSFRQIGEMWTNGELHKKYRSQVKLKRSSRSDALRLQKYVYPVIGDTNITRFVGYEGIELVKKVCSRMSEIAPDLRPASSRNVLQAVSSILSLAVMPLNVLPCNPLPKKFIPSAGPRPAMTYLLPKEEQMLLGCTRIPIQWRLLIGVLAREGMRVSELVGLEWCDFDLENGMLALDENKTDDPRAWGLDSTVAEALRRWKKMLSRDALRTGKIFIHPMSGRAINLDHAAKKLRRYSKLAGLERKQLYEKSTNRIPLRVHDLRGTFVTVSLARGMTESWVADRTGHRSTTMIAKYKRIARTFAEVNIGPLLPLHEIIPELAVISAET